MFWVIVILRYVAPSTVASVWWGCSVTLSEKLSQNIMFQPSCLTVGMVFSVLQTWWVDCGWWVTAKELDFGFNWLQFILPALVWISMITGKLKFCTVAIQGIDGHVIFLPFSNNCSNSGHLLTKLPDGLVAHFSPVQIYSLVLCQPLFLAHGGGEIGNWKKLEIKPP